MDQRPPAVAAPMDRAVMRPLHQRADRPERSDPDRKPDADRLGSGRDLSGETPGQDAENRERDRDEIDMDLEHFPNEQRHRLQIAPPVHDSNQEEIEHHDPKLGERGEAQEEYEVE